MTITMAGPDRGFDQAECGRDLRLRRRRLQIRGFTRRLNCSHLHDTAAAWKIDCFHCHMRGEYDACACAGALTVADRSVIVSRPA